MLKILFFLSVLFSACSATKINFADEQFDATLPSHVRSLDWERETVDVGDFKLDVEYGFGKTATQPPFTSGLMLFSITDHQGSRFDVSAADMEKISSSVERGFQERAKSFDVQFVGCETDVPSAFGQKSTARMATQCTLTANDLKYTSLTLYHHRPGVFAISSGSWTDAYEEGLAKSFLDSVTTSSSTAVVDCGTDCGASGNQNVTPELAPLTAALFAEQAFK